MGEGWKEGGREGGGERGRERRGTATQNAQLKKKKMSVTTQILGNQYLFQAWISVVCNGAPELNISYEPRMPDIGISRSSCRR